MSKSIPALWVAIVAAGLAIVATVLPDADAAETRRDFLEPIPIGDRIATDYLQQNNQVRALSEDGGRALVNTLPSYDIFAGASVFDFETGRRYDHHETGDESFVLSPMAMSGDGRQVLYMASGRAGWVLRLWDVEQVTVRDVTTFDRDLRPPTSLTLSTDGRYAFYPEPVDRSTSVLYRHDLSTGQRAAIQFPNGRPRAHEVVVARDGGYLLYRVDTDHSTIVRRHLTSGVDELVTVLSDSEAGRRRAMAISADGRYLAYAGIWHDMQSGERHLVAANWASENAGPWRAQADLSRRGDLAFITADQLVRGDTNGTDDAYVRGGDGVVRRISVSDLGTQLEHFSAGVVISADGRFAVFGTTDTGVHRSTRPGGGIPGFDASFRRSLTAEDPADNGVVDAAQRPGGGFWTVDRVGRVVAHAGAPEFRDLDADPHRSHERPTLRPGEEVVSIAASPTGGGFWLFTTHGRVLTYGDAPHNGDLVSLGIIPAYPLVDAGVTPSGLGYYLISAEGGVFALGDAEFLGSVPGLVRVAALNEPIVSIAVSPTNEGYLMVAADGGVFTFGDMEFHGSVPDAIGPGQTLNQPIVEVVVGAAGYLQVAADGGIFAFGDNAFHGSLGDSPPPVDVAAVMALADGYVMVDRDGIGHGFGPDAPSLLATP